MEFYEENKYHGVIMREYKFSKAFEKTLEQMKKFEHSELLFNNLQYLKSGEDYEKIKMYFEKNGWEFN